MLDVIILNAYHRGDWLIEQFKSRSCTMDVIDISNAVGAREDADVCGPFGFFSGSNAGLEEWLLKNRHSQLQSNGWALWTENGTYESAGMIQEHQAKQSGEAYQNILKSWFSHLDRPAKFLPAIPSPTSSSGPLLVTKGFAITKDESRTVKAGDKLEFATQPGKKTVTWNDKTFEAHFVISFLLPHEAMALSENGMSQLLTAEPLKPRLCWQRFRAEFKTPVRLDVLPEHLMFVNKLNEPWNEENYLVIQKTGTAGIFDIWYRTWFEVHQDAAYFKNLSEKIAGALKTRFVDLKMTVKTPPAEIANPQLTSMYPIYDIQEWGLQTKWFANAVYSGWLEKCENFTLAAQIDLQMMILRHLDEELKGG